MTAQLLIAEASLELQMAVSHLNDALAKDTLPFKAQCVVHSISTQLAGQMAILNQFSQKDPGT